LPKEASSFTIGDGRSTEFLSGDSTSQDGGAVTLAAGSKTSLTI
jgi:hypothetical protein